MQGAQQPRIQSVPPDGSDHPDGEAALELVAAAGIDLDPWQQVVLTESLRVRDGKWAAFEVGLVCPRQNGKNELLIARELAGLFILRERLIIHSAHQFDTSLEAFRRLVEVVEENDWLLAEVKGGRRGIKRSHGEEGIELRTGQRIRFRTRTKGGGRGFSSDCLILDEAMILPESAHGALLPTLSARRDKTPLGPQVWYTGSAVDQAIHDDGIVLARVRERGVKGDDPALAFFEWSAAADNPADVDGDLLDDEAIWADANPALGIRITLEHIANERRAMDPRTFAVERCGIGDWPNPSQADSQAISLEAWNRLTDLLSQPAGSLVFAFDVSPDRASAAVAVCGRRSDGMPHLEVIDHRRGTGWVVGRLADLNRKHQPQNVVCDGVGPAASLLHELGQEGVQVTTVNASEHAAGCGLLFDGVQEETIRHLGTPELAAAVRGAARRPLGDAWAWSRKTSAVDITPLVAVTLALWGLIANQAAEPWSAGW